MAGCSKTLGANSDVVVMIPFETFSPPDYAEHGTDLIGADQVRGPVGFDLVEDPDAANPFLHCDDVLATITTSWRQDDFIVSCSYVRAGNNLLPFTSIDLINAGRVLFDHSHYLKPRHRNRLDEPSIVSIAAKVKYSLYRECRRSIIAYTDEGQSILVVGFGIDPNYRIL